MNLRMTRRRVVAGLVVLTRVGGLAGADAICNACDPGVCGNRRRTGASTGSVRLISTSINRFPGDIK